MKMKNEQTNKQTKRQTTKLTLRFDNRLSDQIHSQNEENRSPKEINTNNSTQYRFPLPGNKVLDFGIHKYH